MFLFMYTYPEAYISIHIYIFIYPQIYFHTFRHRYILYVIIKIYIQYIYLFIIYVYLSLSPYIYIYIYISTRVIPAIYSSYFYVCLYLWLGVTHGYTYTPWWAWCWKSWNVRSRDSIRSFDGLTRRFDEMAHRTGRAGTHRRELPCVASTVRRDDSTRR